MVVVAKPDGKPRRTIDISQMNKSCSWQTHYTVPPFQQAMSVPAGMKKTVLDCWNGFHSIPLHEEDQHLTTFLTQLWRFKYLVCPQGHLSSTDIYNARFDQILSDLTDYKKGIDDVYTWGKDEDEIFKKTVVMISTIGKAGLIINKEKFQ